MVYNLLYIKLILRKNEATLVYNYTYKFILRDSSTLHAHCARINLGSAFWKHKQKEQTRVLPKLEEWHFVSPILHKMKLGKKHF